MVFLCDKGVIFMIKSRFFLDVIEISLFVFVVVGVDDEVVFEMICFVLN